MPHRGKNKSGIIQTHLRERIAGMAAHDLFPPEVALCEEYGVCRATMNKILKSLEGEGLLVSRQGKGRTVQAKKLSQAPTIAVILDNLESLSHPVMALRVKGISEAIAESDYHLSLFARNPALKGEELLQGLGAFLKDAQGVILATYEFDERVAFEIAMQHPTVWLEHPSDRSGIHGVRSDYLGAGFLAAKHLLELGHTKIAVVGMDNRVSLCRQHFDGVRLAVQNHPGGPVSLQRWIVEDFSTDAAKSVIHRNWSNGLTRPTGIIFASDDLALGGSEAFHGMGIHVPRDVSVVGCNGDERPIVEGLQLTSAFIDFQASGRACVDLIKKIVAKKNNAEVANCQPARLIIGDTSTSPMQQD